MAKVERSEPHPYTKKIKIHISSSSDLEETYNKSVQNEHPSDNESIKPDAIFRFTIVVDGYHVRSYLKSSLPSKALPSSEEIGDWLLCLLLEISYHILYETNSEELGCVGFEPKIIWWDADAREEINEEKVFDQISIRDPEMKRPQTLAKVKNFVDHVERGRSRNITGYNWYVDATMNFMPLKKSGVVDYRQSGVDARIAADLLGSYIENNDFTFLVSSDADYERAMEIIKSRGGRGVDAIIANQTQLNSQHPFWEFAHGVFSFKERKLAPMRCK